MQHTLVYLFPYLIAQTNSQLKLKLYDSHEASASAPKPLIAYTLYNRVAAKIFVSVISRNFREIFSKILIPCLRKFPPNFAKHEI